MKKKTNLIDLLENQEDIQRPAGMITKYGCTPVPQKPPRPGMITKYGCTPVPQKPPRPGMVTKYGCAPLCVNQEDR